MIESPIAAEVLTAQLPEQQSLLMSNELSLNAKSEASPPPKINGEMTSYLLNNFMAVCILGIIRDFVI